MTDEELARIVALRRRLLRARSSPRASRRSRACSRSGPSRSSTTASCCTAASTCSGGRATRALVLDYKTNSLAEGTPEEIVEDDYTLQRLVYALACLRAGAEEVEVVYHFLERPDAVVSTTFERRELPLLESELSAAIARINAGEFVPTPSEFNCSGCPALDLVCAGPRLGGGAWPPRGARRAPGLMAKSYVREARKRVGAEEGTAIRPVIERLAVEHADAKIALSFASPLELLVSVMLSAQTTDVNVNRVTREALREVPAAGGLPGGARGGARAATSSRPASTARRRSRCAG